ncbi:MAG: CoA transferase, partial [Chloroflexota bacterium]|nr:CoA transferase [Chloroflexota bacterium]
MYRVLDLTDAKGMLCSRLLAGMGAEVIRVERPGGDLSGKAADGPSFCYQNSGKRSITLDLESVRGREIFGRLVKTADVLVESFKPGYLDSLGIGYPALCEISPSLVMASITGFGQDGP